MKVPISGGQAVALSSPQDHPSSIAVNSTNVFWANGNGSSGDGAVKKTGLDGGAETTLATSPGIPGAYKGLAIDSSNVYWTGDSSPGSVSYVPIVGGASTVLASGQDAPWGIVVTDGYAFWTNAAMTTGTVMKAPLDGGPAITLATNQAGPAGIAVDSANAYWVNRYDGAVNKVSLSDGGVVTLASINPGPSYTYAPLGIALDSADVYWTIEAAIDGGVMRVPIDGGTITTIAAGQVGPVGICVDEKAVYWTNTNGGTVMKAPK